jgi:hypothetical protein
MAIAATSFHWDFRNLLVRESYHPLTVSCGVGTISSTPFPLQKLNQNSLAKGHCREGD